jgi:selenocysteine-specific elongation factor
MRHYILGTAGHVDHGKTELVRALTGHDTDRLKEEKERGISIELGFAPLPLDDDTFLGIIDVPGHERFVKHMVAGAGGIDMAMLLVAADEGVMPQTEEHMEVLKSLGVAHGLVVVSKYDLAASDTMELLRDEIAALTKGTFLDGAPVVPTSARTGHGIDELKEVLRRLARGIDERDATGPFRVAVDRVFHRKGIGVVITGSGYSGSVSIGDALELLPSGRAVRVRDLQSFGQRRSSGRAGERLALALQGVKLEEVSRGDILASPGAFRPSSTLDVRLELADYFAFEVRNRERVRVHHGAREVMGRVILLDTEALRAGAAALVQIALENPLVAAPKDHFVVRKYSPPRVIGGGRVIDPHPERHRRFDEHALGHLRLKEAGDPEDVLDAAVARAGLSGLSRADADADLSRALSGAGRITEVGGRWFARSTIETLAESVDDIVSEYLARNPLRWGIDKEELRQRCGFPHGSQVFSGMLEELARVRPVFVRGNRVRNGAEDMVMDDATEAQLAALEDQVRSAGAAFATVAELEARWSGRERFHDALQLLKDRGSVVDVGPAGVIHRASIDRCVDVMRGIFAVAEELSVGDLKESLGLSRKHAIPLLEWFDAARVTLRVGNARVKGPAFPD